MSRVMLVCPEPLAHGQPAGVGIRFLEMARVLRDDGHDVTILSPDGGSIEGCRCGKLEGDTLRTISESSDVAVVQGHVANAHFAQSHPVPTVVDLYDPFIVENLHYYPDRGAEVFHHDHLTLMTSIAQGDHFLCASEAQRLWYLGILLAAGRLNPILFERDPRLQSLITIAPFGVQPLRARPERDVAPDILFGGIYDWYDPILAIDAVAIVRQSIPEASLTFTRHPNPGITPQGKLAEAMAYAQRNRFTFVRFEPWVPYDTRAELFERFALALLTFGRSLETDLSMRTRVYDYLWSGLPIVTSSAPGTDEILARYGAGAVVHDDTPEALAAVVVALLGDRERYESMIAGARLFVQDHQWDRALAPLREFCRAPRFDDTREAFSPVGASADAGGGASFLDRLKRRLRALSASEK